MCSVKSQESWESSGMPITIKSEREIELIRNIIKTREELKDNNKNFEFAENDLVDYYIYEIKANQSKLDYLIKLAKASRNNN